TVRWPCHALRHFINKKDNLIEPDWQISRIRLSDKTSLSASFQTEACNFFHPFISLSCSHRSIRVLVHNLSASPLLLVNNLFCIGKYKDGKSQKGHHWNFGIGNSARLRR